MVIKNDNTWTVAGTHINGRVLIENESINLKRAIEGANDHWIKIKINDKNNIEVFREMDSKKWLLVRVADKKEPNWAGGCKFEEERYNREGGWNDWHFVDVTNPSGDGQNFIWKNRAGVEWDLTVKSRT